MSKQQQRKKQKRRIDATKTIRATSSRDSLSDHYSDDDFVSKMLVKWTFRELLATTKILLVLINRCLPPDALPSAPPRLRALLCYTYPCEYVETLFAEHTSILCDDEEISFRRYYNLVYRQACDENATGAMSVAQRRHLTMLLRACFLIALVYEPRIRRFVFSKHDVHYVHLSTRPPAPKKTRAYIDEIRASINGFLCRRLSIDTMTEVAVSLWCERYMFRLI